MLFSFFMFYSLFMYCNVKFFFIHIFFNSINICVNFYLYSLNFLNLFYISFILYSFFIYQFIFRFCLYQYKYQYLIYISIFSNFFESYIEIMFYVIIRNIFYVIIGNNMFTFFQI